MSLLVAVLHRKGVKKLIKLNKEVYLAEWYGYLMVTLETFQKTGSFSYSVELQRDCLNVGVFRITWTLNEFSHSTDPQKKDMLVILLLYIRCLYTSFHFLLLAESVTKRSWMCGWTCLLVYRWPAFSLVVSFSWTSSFYLGSHLHRVLGF